MAREQIARLTALGALAIAVIVVVIVLLTGGSSYTVYAEFQDAGQLVSGDLVTISGHPVGSVGTPKLAQNGLAVIPLNLSDSSVTPLRRGTTATVGQLSLTGVSNRFVSLNPGGGATIPSGGTLPATQTSGIVDLDTLLNALTPQVRTSLQRIIKTGAYLMSGSTPQSLNQAIHYLNPALSQSGALGTEIVADKFALDRLVASTAQVSTKLASREADLAGAVSNTAATLREVASQRAALEDTVARAPAVLSQGTGVLRDLDYSLGVLNPTLKNLQPVAPRITNLLQKVVPAAGGAIPTVRGVAALVTPAEKALGSLPSVVSKAVPAVQSLGSALPPVTPILSGLRPYTADAVAGFFGGVGGYTGGYYDANGHYARLSPGFGPGSFSGILSLLGGVLGSLPPFNGERPGLLATCPGGTIEPAPDHSNPWNNLDTLPAAGSVCNPADNHK